MILSRRNKNIPTLFSAKVTSILHVTIPLFPHFKALSSVAHRQTSTGSLSLPSHSLIFLFRQRLRIVVHKMLYYPMFICLGSANTNPTMPSTNKIWGSIYCYKPAFFQTSIETGQIIKICQLFSILLLHLAQFEGLT